MYLANDNHLCMVCKYRSCSGRNPSIGCIGLLSDLFTFLIIPALPLSLPFFFLITYCRGICISLFEAFFFNFLHIMYYIVFIFILAFNTTSNSPFALFIQSHRLLPKVSYCLYSPVLLCLFSIIQTAVNIKY
jgi:uncharacterized protein YqhQ